MPATSQKWTPSIQRRSTGGFDESGRWSSRLDSMQQHAHQQTHQQHQTQQPSQQQAQQHQKQAQKNHRRQSYHRQHEQRYQPQTHEQGCSRHHGSRIQRRNSVGCAEGWSGSGAWTERSDRTGTHRHSLATVVTPDQRGKELLQILKASPCCAETSPPVPTSVPTSVANPGRILLDMVLGKHACKEINDIQSASDVSVHPQQQQERHDKENQKPPSNTWKPSLAKHDSRWRKSAPGTFDAEEQLLCKESYPPLSTEPVKSPPPPGLHRHSLGSPLDTSLCNVAAATKRRQSIGGPITPRPQCYELSDDESDNADTTDVATSETPSGKKGSSNDCSQSKTSWSNDCSQREFRKSIGSLKLMPESNSTFMQPHAWEYPLSQSEKLKLYSSINEQERVAVVSEYNRLVVHARRVSGVACKPCDDDSAAESSSEDEHMSAESDDEQRNEQGMINVIGSMCTLQGDDDRELSDEEAELQRKLENVRERRRRLSTSQVN